MFQYFFINYTKKQIRYAGRNDVLQDIAYYLNKACELNNWQMTDKIQVFNSATQRNMINNCSTLIMMDDYECEQEYLEFFVGQD
jgi:hypothetical protein